MQNLLVPIVFLDAPSVVFFRTPVNPQNKLPKVIPECIANEYRKTKNHSNHIGQSKHREIPQGTNEDLKPHSARENPSDLQLTFGEQQNQCDLLRKVVKSSLKQTNSRV